MSMTATPQAPKQRRSLAPGPKRDRAPSGAWRRAKGMPEWRCSQAGFT